MAALIAIVYPDEQQASEVMDAMHRLAGEGALELEDAVAVSKDAEGRIKPDRSISRTAEGAAGGLLMGALVGLVFLAPVVGAVFGAVAGALAGKMVDVAKIDDFVLEVADSTPPGSSAILMLVRRANPETVLAVLQQFGGKVVRTTLPDDAEERLLGALGQSAAGAG